MRIETSRLILRPPVEDDWRDVYEGVKDIDVSRMMSVIPHPYEPSDAQEFIGRVINFWKADPQTDYTFFIESKESGKVIGTSGLHSVNRFNGTTFTGSWIRQDHWRQGYILEAKVPILDYAFDTLGLRRVESSAFVHNTASQAMSAKLGFVREGVAIAARRSRATGEIHDEVCFGLFREGWQTAKERILRNSNTVS